MPKADKSAKTAAKAAIAKPNKGQPLLRAIKGGKAVSASTLIKLASSINLAKKQFKPPLPLDKHAGADSGGLWDNGTCIHIPW